MSVVSSSGSSYFTSPPGPSPKGSPASPLTGIPLINGTQNFLVATTPNDGQLHPFTVNGMVVTTVTEVAGQITVAFTIGGVATNIAIDTGGHTAPGQSVTGFLGVADPGTTITVKQNSALTSGAASWYGALAVA